MIQVQAQSLTMRVGLNWSLQLGQISVGEPPDLPSRGDLSVAQGAQVNQEQDSRRPGAVLPSKGDQNKHEPTSNHSAKKEQQVPKNKRTLKSLRGFPLEPVYFKWYRYDSSSIFREILTEFGIKNNVDRFVNILYAAAELIRFLDQGETVFNNRLHYYHNQYCRNDPNETQPTIERFDDYLYRWAMKVWPRDFHKIHESSRNNMKLEAILSFKISFVCSVRLLT